MDLLDLKKSSGIKLDLKKLVPGIKRMKARVTWTMHPIRGASLKDGFDLDWFAFCLNQQGKITTADDVVYFNHRPGNGVELPEDNRTGGGDGETITIDSTRTTHPEYHLYVTIFEAVERNQNFGMITDARVEISDADTGRVIQTYTLNDTFQANNAVHIGSVLVRPDGMDFTPVGIGASVSNANEIASNYL